MPSVKTPSSSLPASPRIGYRPMDLEKVFNNLNNNQASQNSHYLENGVVNGNGFVDGSGAESSKELSLELAQLHLLGAELRSGLMKAVEALRLVQNNDETMRHHLESANTQTQRGISELTRVISAVQDDSTQLRLKLEQLEASNKEMREKMVEFEKFCFAKKSVKATPNRQKCSTQALSPPGTNQNTDTTLSTSSPETLSPVTPDSGQPPVVEPEPPKNQQSQAPAVSQQPFYHTSAVKFRQNFLTFMTSEVHFCRTIGKMCQQQQQAAAVMSSLRAGPMSPTPSETAAASVLPTSLWQVYRVHSEFLAQLESRMSRWGHWGCVGDLFLRLLDNKNSHFADIYKLYANELLSIFGAGGSPVCAPLLLPFRRLADYIGFLEGTRQGLDPDHPDLYNVGKSSEKLRTIITRLNEQQLRFLMVAENVAPVGNGTAGAFDTPPGIEAMSQSFTTKEVDSPSKTNGIGITNGSATIARTRYTQNKTNQQAVGGRKTIGRSSGNNHSTASNLMLKSRSHGDLYYVAQQQDQQQTSAFSAGSDPDAMSDDDDASDDENAAVSPNYCDMFDGDVTLTTRSLPRSRLVKHGRGDSTNQYQHHSQHPHPHVQDETDAGGLDCWASKPQQQQQQSSSSSRPCSATAASANELLMNELQSIPPNPIRSCDVNQTRFSSHRNTSLFISGGGSHTGTISSGSSGSGGSTSGKSSHQPLESVKQSLLNLFNGYKKKKRNTLRNNGLISPASNSSGNAPQIRIISPPSMTTDKQVPFSVLANSNFHVDIRSENRSAVISNSSSNASSTPASSRTVQALTSPPASPSPMLLVPQQLNAHQKPTMLNAPV